MTAIRSERTAIRVPLVLIGLGAVGAGTALVLAMGAAVQRTAFEGGLSAAQVAAVHLADALDGHTRSVVNLAERVGAMSSPAERAERLRAWLSLHQLEFSGLALVDSRSQDRVEMHRPKAGAVFGEEAAALARAAMLRRSSVGWLVEGADAGSPAVLLATPIADREGGAAEIQGALVACLDAEGVAGSALNALSADGEAAAFFASGEGEVLLERASRASSGVRAEGSEMTPPGLAAFVRTALADGTATQILDGGDRTLLAAAVRFEATSSVWVVGSARPWRLSLGEANRFVLLAGLAVVVFLAGAIGVLAALRPGGEPRGGDADEVSRWRAAAAAARRDAWRRAFLAMPGFPVVEIQGTRIVEANVRAARYLAVGSAAVLEGRDVLELVVAEDRERFARFLGQEVPAGGDEDAVTVHMEIQGSGRRVADMRRLPPAESHGSTVLLTWRDGTGRERGEALSRALASVMHVPLVFVDRSGTLVWSNHAFDETARRLGVAVSAASILDVFHPAGRRWLRVMFGAALRGKSSEKLVPLAVGTGNELAVVLRAAPVMVAGEAFGVVFAGQEMRGAPPGAVSLSSDRRAEALAQLAAGLSHRLNNDLQGLQGRIAAARLADSDSTVSGIAAQLEGVARELQRFVSVCRRSGGALRPARLSVLLDGWRISKNPQMPPGVRLVLNSEVTEDRVIVDSRQIESFLDYAVVATTRVLEGEGGAVNVAVERGETPGTVRLSVRDTGGDLGEPCRGAREGLPDTMAREAVLAVAQLVAERHGGAAGWRRAAGVGSHVWLDLPLRTGAVPVATVRPQVRRGGLVLVADDEDMVRSSLAVALREEGFAVDEASNGRDVLEKVLSGPGRYALLVLDLVMPIVDGREVLRRLSREVPALPVLLCTGYDPGAAEDIGGAEVLVKPFSLETFVERVRSLTGAPQQQ